MSWSYSRSGKQSTIKNLLRESKRGDYNVSTRKYELKRDVLWSIEDVKDATGKLISARIICTLLQSSEDGCGWNTIPEEMHPYYYDVPIEWLDEVPAPKDEPGSAAWRKAVRTLAGVQKPLTILNAAIGIA